MHWSFFMKKMWVSFAVQKPLYLFIKLSIFKCVKYIWLLLSRPHLSRITAYLEVKLLSLPKHESLTAGEKYCGKEEKLLLNIFNISLTSRVQLHIYLLNVVVWIIFSTILQIWCVEVRISRSISESPFEFEIMRIDCIKSEIWLNGGALNNYCLIDITPIRRFLLVILCEMKIFCSDWPYLIRNHLSFLFLYFVLIYVP